MPRRDRVTVDAALALLRDAAPTPQPECIVTAAALGRVIAEPVLACRNVPSFRAAAMDGFAVRAGDCDTGLPLRLAGAVPAGSMPSALPAGHAIAISTGAPVPSGADRIVPREYACLSEGALVIDAAWSGNDNIRAIGEDMAKGGVVIGRGTVVGPDAIAAVIASGTETITAFRRPRVAVLSTGNELAAKDDPACIPDSNAPMIAAGLTDLGIDSVMLGVAPDEPARLAALLAEAEGDVIVSTGGVSVGNHDPVRGVLEARGARILLHGVAMRPGKPMLVALLPDGRPFVGLPGNPIAALVGFRFFLTALLRAAVGLPPEQGVPVEVDVTAREGTTLFLRATRSRGADGRLAIDTTLDQRSHILSSVVAADCWLRVDPGKTLLFDKPGRLR